MAASSLTRRNFIRTASLPLAGLAAARALGAEAAPTRRPNIVIFYTDDQRYDTIGALGAPQVKTPNLDGLVRRGTAFTHAHIMGSMSGAVCIPSRASLMTGRTLFHLQKQGQTIPREHTMLPETLRRAGYATFGVGKWHNNPASYARCFDAGGPIFFGGMTDQNRIPVSDFDPTGRYPQQSRHVVEQFSSELFSDSAIRFVQGHKGDKPFFLYVAYTAPHDPRTPPKPFADLYPPDRIELPPNFMPQHPFDNGEMRVRDELLASFPRTPEEIRKHIADYYGMISHVDAQIGRVLKALDDRGYNDNTLVIFAGDNGLAVGRHGLMGKQNLYEHSIRVPLIMAGPGIPRDTRTDGLCYLLDIHPTLCDLLGIAAPATVEGTSLVPLLRKPASQVRDSLFYAYREFQRGIRRDDWKLIRYCVQGRQTTQLFNLKDDPWELRNLATDPAQSDRIRQLTTLMKQRMKQIDDPATWVD